MKAESVSGVILNIMRFSTQDGPGLRTSVFLKGCPLKCSWCHNPESQSCKRELFYRKERCISCGECLKCSESISVDRGVYRDLPDDLLDSILKACTTEARDVYGKRISTEEVMAEVAKDIPFFEESGGGVTFSGGEPFAQPAFLEELLAEAREMDIHVAVDTCGLAAWDTLDRLRENIDLFLFDLKIMDDSRHIKETGASNRTILENLRNLSAAGENILVRVPVIAKVNDDEENIMAMAEFVSSLEGNHETRFLPYHETGRGKYELLERDYPLKEAERPGAEKMKMVARIFKNRGLIVVS